MRSNGLAIFMAGIIPLLLFWYLYFYNITFILSLNKELLFFILFVALVITILCGIIIGVGLKILIDPSYYEKLKLFFK